jgi:RND family efflux transporter MFP subunit
MPRWFHRFPAPLSGLFFIASPALLEAQEYPVVLTAEVRSGRLERVVRQSVSLEPFEKVTVHARVTGYARDVVLDLGDEVERGQVLVELETPELEADLASAAAELGTAAALVERATADLELKQALHELALDLFEKQGRTRFQLKEAAAGLKLAQAELALAKARQAEAQGRERRVAAFFEYSRVRAPFAGVITRRYVDTGALVRGGAGGEATRLFEVQRRDRLRCRLEVPERDALLVLESHRRKALSVELAFDALPGRTVELSPEVLGERGICFAKVLHSEAKHMLCEIHLPNADGGLLPGLFGRAALVARGSVDGDVALVPAVAVQAPRSGATHVFVVQENEGKMSVRRQSVEIGATDGERVEVLRGLAAGERIVVRGAGTLVDGQTVVARAEEGPGKRS